VRAGIVERPEEYEWSSYRYYIGKRKEPDWLKVDFILSYFGRNISSARRRYKGFVKAVFGEGNESPLKEVVASTILGGEDFIKEIKSEYLKDKGTHEGLSP